jgi:hypothetical protein
MPPQRSKGIEVKTVTRHARQHQGADANADAGPSSSRRSLDTRPSSKKRAEKRRSRPSVRYREQAVGAARPGENFFKDPLVAGQLEERVLEM